MKTILGVTFLLLVAYLLSYRLRSLLATSLGMHALVTSGSLFILCGIILGTHGFDLLSLAVVRDLAPLIYLGLGWVGFLVGIQFEWRLLKNITRKLFLLAQLESVVSLGVLLVGCFALFSAVAWRLNGTVSDVVTAVLVVSICGSISSSLRLKLHGMNMPAPSPMFRLLEYLVSLHVFVPLIALTLLFSFYHVSAPSFWQMAGWFWLAAHMVAGCFLGLLLFLLLRPRLTDAERLLLVLGGITFSAGLAAYLHLSPVIVCFLAGLVFANLPGLDHEQMHLILKQAERPIYLMLLILAGSMWDFRSPVAWGCLMAYLVIRACAKGLALKCVSQAEPSVPFTFPLVGSLLAQGPLAIAIVVGYAQLYRTPLLNVVMTVVLGGTLVNEVFSARLLRRTFPERRAAS